MRQRAIWLVTFFLSVCLCIIAGNSGLSHAGNINATIDGQAPATPSSGSCNNAAACINIGGTYGVLQVTPVSGDCNSNACARIDVPVDQLVGDSLHIINARITNTGGSDKTFLIFFEREDVAQPNSTKYYNTYLIGNFGAVAGNSISSKSYFKPNGGTYAQVGSTLSHTVQCPFGICATPFTKKTGAQKNPGTNPRWIKGEITITLKPGSFVDLNSGHRLVTSNTAPDGTVTDGGLDDCPSCTPSSQLSVFCSTTYSTAKMFGCPSCVTEDGQVAADAKVKLFASTNWDNLVQDMARGQGEHLASLAALLKIPANQQSEFFVLAQETYQTSTGGETPEQVVASLHETWSSH